jgi:hypothetical protein
MVALAESDIRPTRDGQSRSACCSVPKFLLIVQNLLHDLDSKSSYLNRVSHNTVVQQYVVVLVVVPSALVVAHAELQIHRKI